MAPAVHPAAVELQGAIVLLDRFPALAGVDLDVARGEIVLLRGPNGAGKTTLLRACAGLARVSRGRATVLGVDVAAEPRSIRRRVGMLAHDDGLYADLDAADNLRFWAKAAGVRDVDAERILDRCGISGRVVTVPAARLSTGQRRRAALAGLVARRPELWLLDEPHAGLDRAGRDLVDQLVVDAAGAGATVLFASHELDRAEALSTRVVTIAGGVVRHDTAPGRTAGESDQGRDQGQVAGAL